MLPSIGECSIVDLNTLINEKLIDEAKYGNCNLTTTYVKHCILENGNKHYTPWLTCINHNSELEYSSLNPGTMADVVANSTYIDFKFLPQEANKENEILGPEEELWQDEIKYSTYKTISTIKYYRYRDKLYIWDLVNRSYYTSSGDKKNESEVNEYYASTPNANYNHSTSGVVGYKWYSSDSTKEYYTVNGERALSTTAVGDYNIKDPQGVDKYRYRTRGIVSSYAPTKYYICATNSSTSILRYQPYPCGTGVGPEFNVERKPPIYSCESDPTLVMKYQVSANTTCYKYTNWSNLTDTPCDINKPNICERYVVTYYYWYKYTNSQRKYYPSGASYASNEKVYYTSEPYKGAIKDTSTERTVYKWYTENKTTSTNYSATPPSGYTQAIKTNSYTYSNWSEYSSTNPAVKDGRDREIETKTKVKLQEIKGGKPNSYNNLSEDYIGEEELIKTFQNKGYKVNTLEDITNNGEIRYLVKMYIRNKKESK